MGKKNIRKKRIVFLHPYENSSYKTDESVGKQFSACYNEIISEKLGVDFSSEKHNVSTK